ncbi:uncharacterized protein LOC112540646 [Python bivittatus]|uniref:Uncharacterized protein LOC112540646 n=1 Tax=Python bivittatus TaxID=176946 RepID=A0A9F5IED5_PYTBI|nr:uncharacterized protein LOC112540646 [Python bivittatus]
MNIVRRSSLNYLCVSLDSEELEERAAGGIHKRADALALCILYQIVMKTEYGTQLALGGTRRASMSPYLPACFSHHYQPCFPGLLGTCSRSPQNRGLSSQDQEKSKLLSLKVPGARIQPRRDGCWNCPSSNMSLDNGLKNKHTYFHFSKPVRLAAKPGRPCKASRDVLQGPKQRGCARVAHHTMQDFTITGLNCRPPWHRDPSLLPQIRRPKMELHVYVPSEKARAEVESWDEDVWE